MSASLSGSSHAMAHTIMLQANCGMTADQARERTEEYLANLDRISANVAAARAARFAEINDDDRPPF